MKKYLIISIILLVGLTSYLGYQNYIQSPVLEFVVHEDTAIFFEGKFYDVIQESMSISHAPIGKYEMGNQTFEVDNPNTTVFITYK
jgi:hypothetical protein